VTDPFSETTNRMALKACEVTRPVFEHVPHLPPQFAGTGILVRLLDVPYFITAAHVQDIAPDGGLLGPHQDRDPSAIRPEVRHEGPHL